MKTFRFLLLVFLGVLVTSCQHDVRFDSTTTPTYDYSSPAASFRSLQSAVHARDPKGFWFHMWKGKHRGKPNLKLEDLISQATSDGWSWSEADSVYGARTLPLSRAKFLRDEPEKQWEDDVVGKVTMRTIIMAWPDKGKGARAYVFKFEGEKEWFVLPPMDPDSNDLIFELKEGHQESP